MNTLRLPVRTMLVLTTLFCLNACKDDLNETVTPTLPPVTGPDSTRAFAVEEAYPGYPCVWKKANLFGQPITYAEINGEAVFQGDIILTPEQLAGGGGDSLGSPNGRTSGAGTSNNVRRWRNFLIPYTIDPNLPNQARVTNAITHWATRTPVRFVVRTTETDYITFQQAPSGVGCDSHVGRVGKQQFIRLASGCTTGSVIHEIGHAAGLFHEMSRSDRDNHVTINTGNIQAGGFQNNFEKYESGNLAGFDSGDFDFGSVMMYPSDAFSKNGQPTIVRTNGTPYTAQRNALSIGDLRTVIAMYGNVYITWKDKLYAVSVSTGDFTSLGSGWAGAARTIAEDNDFLWAIQGNTLWRTNRFSGQYSSFGGGWDGAVGVAGADPNGNLYAVQGTRLWKIDRNGQRTRLGGVQALENWTGTEALFYHNGFLYIVWQDTLYKLSTQTGLVVKNLGNNYGGLRGIAAANGSSVNLYVVWGNTLYRVNTDTGAFTQVGANNNFPNTAGIVGVAGRLYVVSGNIFYVVDENGNKLALSSGWLGAESMGVVRNAGLF
ncbi:MAG: hypothetical protein H7Z75_23065 [Ferruginibacter sp.]|nr:hypothetical protein [Cytophagales bacterium]